ncbi:hypothetical protein J2T13_004547 [Paenibacillus sp. DS2015]|uniref:hypothetical protein n=1 Tax=Paenibacillus sp. DS2015 TaxID=3373917 RepID=UPI003D210C56
MQFSLDLQYALKESAQYLNLTHKKWLLGGSCGLLLQGVKLTTPPHDIDLYADTDSIKVLHQALAKWSVDEQVINQSGLYSSILSHYQYNGAQMELVGNFKVMVGRSVYEVQVETTLEQHAVAKELEGVAIRLMPLSHELIFNLLRNRPDRYQAIAKIMKDEPEVHAPLMDELLSRNLLEDCYLQQLSTLLDYSSLQKYS